VELEAFKHLHVGNDFPIKRKTPNKQSRGIRSGIVIPSLPHEILYGQWERTEKAKIDLLLRL